MSQKTAEEKWGKPEPDTPVHNFLRDLVNLCAKHEVSLVSIGTKGSIHRIIAFEDNLSDFSSTIGKIDHLGVWYD